MVKGGYIYILTNYGNTVLYVGVTACLEKRLYEHRNNVLGGFTEKYKTYKLVHYEKYDRIECAIYREKELKGMTRTKKEALIKVANPNWDNLSV